MADLRRNRFSGFLRTGMFTSRNVVLEFKVIA
jgi:hypothetical protein